MTCRQCQATIYPGRHFCFNCGAALVASCHVCGHDNQSTDRFCGRCGQPMTSSPPAALSDHIFADRSALEGERKQVTILFADLKDSMELLAGRDPEEARKLLDPALALMMQAVREYEGTVNQVMGDGIMALFGAPVALEDHAVRACHAALRMQQSLERYARELHERGGATLRIRIGLNSGEVVVRAIGSGLAMDYTAVGESTHLAGRMEQLARPGAIFMTSRVARLAEGHVEARPLGEMAIKGLADPVTVYELTGLTGARSRLDIGLARGLTPFAGRELEMAALAEAAARARAGRGQVVGIVGEPGVGKSRLMWELLRSDHLRGWVVLRAGAAPYAKRTPYLPVIELLRAALAIGPSDDAATTRTRLAEVLTPDEAARFLSPVLALLDLPVDDARWNSLDAGQRRRRTLDAAKYLVTRRAREGPLCLAVEDAHWIDDETEAVLDALVESAPPSRVLILVSYRPEWRHGWASKTGYNQVRVNPLPAAGADALLDALLGRAPELASIRRLLIERTDGNPFFLEESVRNLVEHRVLAGGRGAYRPGPTPSVAKIPESVHAALAARIDRLSPEDKKVLQAASAIGKDVPRRLLASAADVAEDALREGLGRLQERELLHEIRLDPEITYTFTHALTQEVAYAGLVRDRRHALHARIVDAIERRPGGAGPDQIDALAHHAVRGELWDAALRYCREAGARAFTRSAHRGAAAYFNQALAALEHLPSTRDRMEQAIDLRLELRHALSPLGDYRQMFEALTEAERLAASLGDQRRHGAIASFLCNAFTLRGDFARAVEHGERATTIATSLDDHALEAVATATLSLAHYASGQLRSAVAAGKRTVPLGDPAHSLPFGIVVPPAVYGRSIAALALADLGEFAEGRCLAAEALDIATTLDHPHSVIFASIGVGTVALRRGEAEEALAILEHALALWRTADLPAVLVEFAGPLASAYAATGRAGDAIALIEESVALAMALRQRFGHVVRTGGLAEAYLAAGRVEDAVPMAQLYVEIARSARLRSTEAWGLHLLAEVEMHREAADAEAATATLAAGLALAEELGMRPLAARCRLTEAALAVARDRPEDARNAATLALEQFRALDMPRFATRADAILRQRS